VDFRAEDLCLLTFAEDVVMSFDPRTMSAPVYEALSKLRSNTGQEDAKLQKNQAIELYTYLATWGMMRLKAEEKAISETQKAKKQVVKEYFRCLEKISGVSELASDNGLETLKQLSTDEYLGLTGLGLSIAQEFSFWAAAVYHDIKGEA
jgi:hypothetical protein